MMSKSAKVVYLNNAGMARLSEEVQKAGIRNIQDQFLPDDDDAATIRSHFAQLIAADPKRIAIMPSTAFAITLAAKNLICERSQGTIIVLQDQFSSAIFPWQRACQLNKNVHLHFVQYPREDETWTEKILRDMSEIPDIVAVCLPPLHWSDGSLLDLDTVSHTCFCRNIPFVVDATQAVGAVRVSVENVALLASSVHKWLRAPAGTCLVYINPAFQESWQPLDDHGRGRLHHPDRTDQDGYSEDFFPDARKFDSGGKPNPILLPMVRTSLDKVVQLDVEELQEKLREICQPLLDWASSDHRVVLPKDHKFHLIGVKPTGTDYTSDTLEHIQKRLLDEYGVSIAVRCGGFRISPYLDNTVEDMVCLVQALDHILHA